MLTLTYVDLCLRWLMLTLTYVDVDLRWCWLMLTLTYFDADLCWRWPMLTLTYVDVELYWCWLMLTLTYVDADLCWRWLTPISSSWLNYEMWPVALIPLLKPSEPGKVSAVAKQPKFWNQPWFVLLSKCHLRKCPVLCQICLVSADTKCTFEHCLKIGLFPQDSAESASKPVM